MAKLLLPILLALVWPLTACDLPRDPEGTYKRVQGGTLRVGVIEHGPWARMQGQEAVGVDPALVRQLAQELDAEVKWIAGPAFELLEALKRRELDLVIGGLTQDLPWRQDVAFTVPYVRTPIDVGGPPGHRAIGDIEGLTVAVEAGTPIVAMVKARGATAVPVDEQRLPEYDGLIAAPRWRLRAWGRVPMQVVLHERRYVWAAPPGENRWLVHVERFLHRQRGKAEALLVAEVAAGTEAPR